MMQTAGIGEEKARFWGDKVVRRLTYKLINWSNGGVEVALQFVQLEFDVWVAEYENNDLLHFLQLLLVTQENFKEKAFCWQKL